MRFNSFVFYIVIFFSLNIRAYSQTITVPNSNPTTTRSLCSYFFNQGVGVAFSDWVFPSNPTNLVVDNSSGMPYSSGIYDLHLYVKWKNISDNAKPQNIKAEYLIGSGRDYNQITVGPFALTMPPPSFISGTSINISCYDTNPVTIKLNPYINTGESSKYIDENEIITNYFEWTLPTGWRTTSGQIGTFVSTSSISVIPESSISSTSISVRGYANSQRGEIATLQITRNIKAFSISGPVNVYFNSINRYTVPLVPGFSYSWQIPSGWQSSGSTTNSIDVLANCSIGNITCTMTGCSQTKTSSLSIISNTLNSGTMISGSSIVCSSGATFTLSTLPAGCSVLWTKSDNLVEVSGQGTSVYKVKAWGGGGGGAERTSAIVTPVVEEPGSSGSVQAVVSNSCGGKVIISKTVWVGFPGFRPVVTGPTSITCGISNMYLEQHQQSIYWSVPSSMQIVGPAGPGYKCTVKGLELAAAGVIGTVSNACGTYSDILEVDISCNHLSFSPNPATNQVDVTIVKDDLGSDTSLSQKSLSVVVNEDHTVRILNTYGVTFYTGTKTGDCFTLPVDKLKDGIYIVQVSNGNTIYSNQLVVKH